MYVEKVSSIYSYSLRKSAAPILFGNPVYRPCIVEIGDIVVWPTDIDFKLMHDCALCRRVLGKSVASFCGKRAPHQVTVRCRNLLC